MNASTCHKMALLSVTAYSYKVLINFTLIFTHCSPKWFISPDLLLKFCMNLSFLCCQLYAQTLTFLFMWLPQWFRRDTHY